MKLADSDILRLLPEHISGDPQFAATGLAANPVLAAISKAIPNLLIWARLGKADPAKFLPPLRRLTEARPGLRDLDIETLESLAWQFHVDFREVARTKEELAGMVLNSIPWHRIKGTPASIYAALTLCGFSGITIEEHDPNMPWAAYQLGFAEIAEIDDLARIVAICNEMQPARCKLWRVYVDDYDMRPGVWSGPLPRNSWSNAWWSYYSGSYFPEIPGLDDKGLMVSFGLKRKFQVEPFAPSDNFARIWQERARAFIIRRLTHYVWSYSRWSDLYPPRHGFVVGELLSLHACEWLTESGPWPGKPWPLEPWQKKSRWDRRLPDWSMFYKATYKSQGIYSDSSDKDDSAWSALNCNWSWPVLAFVPPAPKWSDGKAKWSGEKQRVRYEIIKEQFRHFWRVQAREFAPQFADSAMAGIESLMAFKIRLKRGPVWGEDDYSEVFPRYHGFIGQQRFAGLVGEALFDDDLVSREWPDEEWPEDPWSKIIGYGRRQPPWQMGGPAVSKSQGVYSDFSDKEPSAWSELNANWSRPLVLRVGKPPVWGQSRYSDAREKPRYEVIHEQFRQITSCGTPPLVGDMGQIGLAIHEESACAIRKIDSPTWSESTWSGPIERMRGTAILEDFSSIVRDGYYKSQNWPDEPWPSRPWCEPISWNVYETRIWERGPWSAGPWRKLIGIERPQLPFGAAITNIQGES